MQSVKENKTNNQSDNSRRQSKSGLSEKRNKCSFLTSRTFKNALIILLVSVGLIALYYSKDLLVSFLGNREDSIESSNLRKHAQELSRNGYLENSAVSYYSYLNSDPSKMNKILAYKDLFEVEVLRGDIDAALNVLDKLAEIEPKDPSVYIYKLKLLLREERLQQAQMLIKQYAPRFKKAPDFINLTATYYMIQNDYESALREMKKIPRRKLENEHLKKIVHCYVKLNRFSEAMSYLHRKGLDNNKEKAEEFLLLKGAVQLFDGEQSSVFEDLHPTRLSPEMRSLGYKLQVFTCMQQQRESALTQLLENQDVQDIYKKDPRFLAKIGDYYAFTKDYEKARLFYEKIAECREYTQQELFAFTDICYRSKAYAQAQTALGMLNRQYHYRQPDYFKNNATLSLCQGEFANAVHELKQGSELHSEDYDFYLRLAYLYGERNDIPNALKYLEEGKLAQKAQTGSYDRNFDLLRIKYAGQRLSMKSAESELLEMRERPDATPEAYFRLIRFYLEHRRVFDAQRELKTIGAMPLSKEQRAIYNVYGLFLAMLQKDQSQYNEIRFKILTEGSVSPLYIALIQLLDGNYEKSLETLTEWKGTLSENDKSSLEQIDYLYAINYYLLKDIPEAYQALNRLEPGKIQNAGYLRNLLQDIGGTK